MSSYPLMHRIRSTCVHHHKLDRIANLVHTYSRRTLLSRMPGYSSYQDANSQHTFPGHSRNLTYVPNYGFVEVDRDSNRTNHRARPTRNQEHAHRRDYRENPSDYYYDPRDRRYLSSEREAPYGEHSHYRYSERSHSNMDRQRSRSPARGSRNDNRPSDRSASPRRPPTGPRAYREHDDTPVPPPPPQKPSDEYLAIASQSPSKLPDSPESSRKLLIMDLNGTLLHRAAVPRRKDFPPMDNRPRDSGGRPLPRLRPVHPRPYMPAFRDFLFAPETKQWLDSMIWSSAQPHSVNDMVGKTFGQSQNELLTIWARDTLGLTDEHYGLFLGLK